MSPESWASNLLAWTQISLRWAVGALLGGIVGRQRLEADVPEVAAASADRRTRPQRTLSGWCEGSPGGGGTQAGDGGVDEAFDGCRVVQVGGGGQGVQAVEGEFVGWDVVAYGSGRGGVGDQLLEE